MMLNTLLSRLSGASERQAREETQELRQQQEANQARQREMHQRRFDKAKNKQGTFNQFRKNISDFFRLVDVKESHVLMFMSQLNMLTKPVKVYDFTNDIVSDIIARHKKHNINLKAALESLIENDKLELIDKLKILRNLVFPQSLLQSSSSISTSTSEVLLEKYNMLMERIQLDERFWQASENSVLRFNIQYFEGKKAKNENELESRVRRLETIAAEFDDFSKTIINVQQSEKECALDHKRKRMDYREAYREHSDVENEDDYGYDDVGSSNGCKLARLD